MALCCNPLSGNINRQCGAKRGGMIRELYASNLCDISGVTFASGEVIAIDMKLDPLTSADFYFFQLGVKKNTAGFINEAQIGTNNKFWNQTVSFIVEGFDAATKASFETLIDGSAVFIGVTADGKAHLLGRVDGASMTAGTLGSGIQLDDLNGGSCTFVANEVELTPSIASGTTIRVLNEDGVTVDVITL